MSKPFEVVKLVQPSTFDGLSQRVEEEIEAAYWDFDARHKGHHPGRARSGLGPQSERDAFKAAVREMFVKLRAGAGAQ